MQRWHFKWIMPQQPSIFWYSFRPHFVQKRQPSRWSFSRSFILSDLHQGKYVTIWNIASQDIQILHTVSKNPARYAKMPCHIFESWIVYVQTRSRYIMQGVRKLEQRHSCSNKTFRQQKPYGDNVSKIFLYLVRKILIGITHTEKLMSNFVC